MSVVHIVKSIDVSSAIVPMEAMSETAPNQEAQANVSIPETAIIDHDKNTTLHVYAAEGKSEEIQALQVDRRKVDPVNYLGWTPLMMACRRGHPKTVKVLLEKGANACLENRYQMSVFLIAVSNGNAEIVHLVLQHLLTGGVSRRVLQRTMSPLAIGALFRNEEIVQYLLMRNFDVNAATPTTKITPLMLAAAVEEPQLYFLLLQHGAERTTLRSVIGASADDIRRRKVEDAVPTTPEPLTPAELISKSPRMGPLRTYGLVANPASRPHWNTPVSPIIPTTFGPMFLQPAMFPAQMSELCSPMIFVSSPAGGISQFFFGEEFPQQPHPMMFTSWNGTEEFNMAVFSPSIFNSPLTNEGNPFVFPK